MAEERNTSAAHIRQMLADHGYRTQWIAEHLDLPVETVEEFAAEMRVRDCDLVPDPILKLVRELHAAEEGSEDYEKLHEIVRQLAFKANSVLFRMASNRIAAQIPPGAFADLEDEPEELFEGEDPIDVRIGLHGKKNPDQ